MLSIENNETRLQNVVRSNRSLADAVVEIRNKDVLSQMRKACRTVESHDEDLHVQFATTIQNQASSFTLADELSKHSIEGRPYFPFSSHDSKVNFGKITIKRLSKSVIVVEGKIGAGKSVFCENLLHEFLRNGYPCVILPEFVNQKLLSWFLEDKEKRAFAFQMIMLYERIESYKRALKLKKRGTTVILDRSLHGDMAFELMHYWKGSITEKEHGIYLDVIDDQGEALLKPDYCIFLDVKDDTAMKLIEHRNRPGEAESYDHEYLDTLGKAYALCLSSFDGPLLRVEYDNDVRREQPLVVSSSDEEDNVDDCSNGSSPSTSSLSSSIDEQRNDNNSDENEQPTITVKQIESTNIDHLEKDCQFQVAKFDRSFMCTILSDVVYKVGNDMKAH